jgi:hypothetical protein
MARRITKREIQLEGKLGTVFFLCAVKLNLLRSACLADVSDVFLPNGTCLCFNETNADLHTAG